MCVPHLLITAFVAAALLADGRAAGAPVAKPYIDHTRPLYFLGDDGTEHPVRSPENWARRRADILAGMQEVMGPLPPRTRSRFATPTLATISRRRCAKRRSGSSTRR